MNPFTTKQRKKALVWLSLFHLLVITSSNYLVQLLKLTGGNVADAARIAERNRTEFYRLLQKYDLSPAMFRADSGLAAE